MLIETPPKWAARALPTGDRDWDKMQQQLVNTIALVVPQAVAQNAEAVMEEAYDAWPVATGRSREGLELRYTQTSQEFSVIFDNEVSYANEIHDGETVADLITGRMEETTKRILLDVERLIGRS